MDSEEHHDLMVDFYNGAHFLEMVAAWAYAAANHQMILEQGAAFEKAYEQLIKLRAAGNLDAGPADFSEENLERVKRILWLIQPGLDSCETRQAAPEIQALAERCLQGLTPSEASPTGREGP